MSGLLQLTKHFVDCNHVDEGEMFDQAIVALKEVYDLDLEIKIAEQIGQLLVPLGGLKKGWSCEWTVRAVFQIRCSMEYRAIVAE